MNLDVKRSKHSAHGVNKKVVGQNEFLMLAQIVVFHMKPVHS